MLQIGKIILNKIKETNQTPAAIARKMQISRTGLYTMLATNDFKLSRLQQLSQELNHNFFQYYITTNQPFHIGSGCCAIDTRSARRTLPATLPRNRIGHTSKFGVGYARSGRHIPTQSTIRATA